MHSELETDVLIVGGGSRALLVLERFATAVAAKPDRAVKVTVADPGPLGPGLHDINQPSYLTFNSRNSCPTIFVNRRVPSLEAAVTGKSFEEWLNTGEGDLSQDFQSRAVAGRYLSWSARHLLTSLPPNLQVEHLCRTVVAAAPPSSGRLTFHADGAITIRPRAAILTVGHGFTGAKEELAGTATGQQGRIVTIPFPTHVRLNGVGKGHKIAIRGLGLTALDVMAELTIGRGGRFESDDSGTALRYVATGEEPAIYLYSRSSCPIRARPDGSFGGSTPFVPVILTDERAAELLGGDQRIEFRTEIFPLILAEMAHRLLSGTVEGLAPEPLARIRQWFANGGTQRSSAEICAFFQSPDIHDALFALIRPVLRDGIPGTRALAMAFLREDIGECRRGLSRSCLKHAIEALIEARVFVKQVIDFRHDRLADPHWAFRTFSGLVNRNAIGPQPRKSEEFLALLKCGLAEIAPAGSLMMVQDGGLVLTGSSIDEGIAVDRLICADHLNLATPEQAGFVRSLMSVGLALPVLDEDQMLMGLKIDRDMRLIADDRSAGHPLWAIGPICDGSTYYNNYLPCIQPDAEYPYFEADRIARSLLESLDTVGDGRGP